MTIQAIIDRVRWCIDEETGYADKENTYMNNIIISRIGDAMRWVTLNADATMLAGSDEKNKTPGILKNYLLPSTDTGAPSFSNGVITLPENVIKVVRVKGSGWHRAVKALIADDSEEYLMLNDETATASLARPQAALVESYPYRVEVYPKDTAQVEITIAVEPENIDANTDGGSSTVSLTDTVAIPPKSITSFIYYIAFLVLAAYNDTTKANVMLSIAKMNLGRTD